MKNDPRLDWISEYVQGRADAEVTARLEQALREDPEFRALFLDYLSVDGALSAHAAYRPLPEADSSLGRAAHRQPSRPLPTPVWKGLAWAASIAVAGVLAWSAARERSPFARVHGSAGTELNAGMPVRSERYCFEKGSVEFVTSKGARVVVEAPAEVRFESAECLRVFRGKVAADVPEGARGFTVLTPAGGAVDLGTRFGVDVPESGSPEVHVFEGEVIAQAKSATQKRSLRTGEATVFKSGVSESREIRSASFIQHDEVPELAAGLAAGQRAKSEAKLRSLRADPALVAALDFEEGEAFAGVHRMAQGRWPGSKAPEFVNQGDHLKVSAGEGLEFTQLTLAAWVRIDRLGEPFQSLYHTDGWGPTSPGQVHWMITKATTMRLALYGNTQTPSSTDSVSPVLPERGRWVHLATVYDSSAGRMRFYLNGRFDNETRSAVSWPAKLGQAQIGNWNRHDRKLSGRVDELILLGRAMSDAEVWELFEAGNPYR